MSHDANKHHTTSLDRARRWQRRSAVALTALVVTAATASCERASEPGEIQGAPQASALFTGIPQKGDALGDPAAPVTITELSDLQCPFCREFALKTLPVLVDRYVRTGRVRIVFHNLPILGEDSERAARVAVAAGLQDRMWQFVDVFFWNQGEEGTGYVTDAFLRRVAAAVPKLDVDRVMADRDKPEVRAQLAESARRAREEQVRGVPSFTIGLTGEPARPISFKSVSDPDSFIAPIQELLQAKPDAR